MKNIPVTAALNIAKRLCDKAGVELVLPDDPRRYVVVGFVALAHKTKKTGVTLKHVHENVTVTLPGVPGLASGLLKLVPGVGDLLAKFAEKQGKTCIFLSPNAMASGVSILRTIFHELGHAGDIKRGGLGWCLAYLIAAEVRAGGETPCFSAAMAVGHFFGLVLEAMAAEARRSLLSYGLDEDAMFLVDGLLAQAVVSIKDDPDFGGIITGLKAELVTEGLLAA